MQGEREIPEQLSEGGAHLRRRVRRKGLPGCCPYPNRNFKNKDVVDTIISKYFPHLPFSRNQPQQSTDD
jgi:hypothetical protein